MGTQIVRHDEWEGPLGGALPVVFWRRKKLKC